MFTRDRAAADFARDGFAVVRSAILNEQVRNLRALMDRLDEASVPASTQILYTHSEPPAHRPGMDRLMDQWFGALRRLEQDQVQSLLKSIRAAVVAICGVAAVPFQDVVLRKTTRHAPFPWHQDLPFWPIDRDDGAVCWVALDEITADNGGLELAPGSHLRPIGPAMDLHTGTAQEGSSGHDWRPDEGQVPHLRPGDAVVFHPQCWHRSGVNAMSLPRRALAVSWVAVEARWSSARAPRHPVFKNVKEGCEVAEWSRRWYPLA